MKTPKKSITLIVSFGLVCLASMATPARGQSKQTLIAGGRDADFAGTWITLRF